MSKRWYAVTSMEYDAWDRGSTVKREAQSMALDACRDGETNVKIAQIENDYCVAEIDF